MPAKENLQKLVELGKITPDEMSLALNRERQVEMVAPEVTRIKLLGFAAGKVTRYAFDHRREEEHFQQRMDVKEGIHHAIGLVAFAAIGAVDGVIDSAMFAAGELVNDVTFGTSRIIFRASDGWKKGKLGTHNE